MNNKFLPIGSVCTLKGKNKKVMVTGYYSVEFNGNLKIDDYRGCAYPEGLLLPEFICNFNHNDIEKVDFVGYQNDEQKNFNALLMRLTNSEEGEEYQKDDWVLSSSNTYSKLLFDENGVVVLAEPVSKDDTKNKLKFNENGIVVEDENSKFENPFYKDYSHESSLENSSNEDIFNKNDIDVISENDNKNLNKIEFDENGVVISDNIVLSENKNNVQYKFDENGILIAIENEAETDIEEIPPIGPGLPGYVQLKNKKTNAYKFDENGILISASDNDIVDNIPAVGPGLPGYVEPDLSKTENE